MGTNLPEIAKLVGPGAAVIEFGAGSNVKARQLLRGLDNPAAYVPVDISGDYLAEQLAELVEEFPERQHEGSRRRFHQAVRFALAPGRAAAQPDFLPGIDNR